MKKLLFINGHLNPGGVEKSLLDILCHLDYSKYEVDLLLLEEYGGYSNQLPKQVNVRLVDLHNTYGAFGSCIVRCIRHGDWQNVWRRLVFKASSLLGQHNMRFLKRSIVGTQQYDCVIGFRPGISAALAAYATDASKRILWWHHGEMNLSEREQEAFIAAWKKADFLVSVSEACAKMLRSYFPEMQDKLVVIPNMLDIESVCHKADEYIPFDKNEDTFYFSTVGRLSQEKHIENAIYAARLLKQKEKKFQWYIVGDGACADQLKALALEQQVADLVKFVGNQTNPYPYMRAADALIHTSYVESQCLVVLEAMAIGTPCVVTESLGPKEFCVDGVNCILVKQGVEALVDGIEAVMKLKSCEAMEQNARDTVDRFTPSKVMKKIEEII